MRTYSALALTCSLVRADGGLLKKQIPIVLPKLVHVLQLSAFQRQVVRSYLNGAVYSLELLERFLTPAEARSITDFVAWYNCEYTCAKDNFASTCFVVSNLNTGAIVVFTHGGFRTKRGPLSSDAENLASVDPEL